MEIVAAMRGPVKAMLWPADRAAVGEAAFPGGLGCFSQSFDNMTGGQRTKLWEVREEDKPTYVGSVLGGCGEPDTRPAPKQLGHGWGPEVGMGRILEVAERLTFRWA